MHLRLNGSSIVLHTMTTMKIADFQWFNMIYMDLHGFAWISQSFWKRERIASKSAISRFRRLSSISHARMYCISYFTKHLLRCWSGLKNPANRKYFNVLHQSNAWQSSSTAKSRMNKPSTNARCIVPARFWMSAIFRKQSCSSILLKSPENQTVQVGHRT